MHLLWWHVWSISVARETFSILCVGWKRKRERLFEIHVECCEKNRDIWYHCRVVWWCHWLRWELCSVHENSRDEDVTRIGCIRGPLHQEQCHSFFLSLSGSRERKKSHFPVCERRNVTHPSDLERERVETSRVHLKVIDQLAKKLLFVD